MGPIDKRNRLDEEPFGSRIAKNNSVFIDYQGKPIKSLKGTEAEKFLQKINAAQDSKEVQLLLAKITGNFKRGNERLASTKNKRFP
ncbi:hypothetical protein T458_22350 [Brevibacillus panacihumi W25]|uniref:Uncharacterized protein n=2 Tax=Brevibacillus panacihumi TaxID=497735 RepID=V6M5E0_9BACL|nr:hypothetical protein [Brevibacillus panacihumi]EST53527.1 hypothetical protein T458_22350 [Brevibacillus panacihumi W25]RNB78010.1 hypothetical protein EDM58_13470 [Brevibacillus panacihumi]